MDIQHSRNDQGGKFYIDEQGESATELVYKMSGPQKMIIEHTEVGEEYEGRGIGKQLVAAAVAYARQHSMKILPMCPFAKAVMDKVDEYHDMLVR
jgi:predicted GNAT family acetyltransferase